MQRFPAPFHFSRLFSLPPRRAPFRSNLLSPYDRRPELRSFRHPMETWPLAPNPPPPLRPAELHCRLGQVDVSIAMPPQHSPSPPEHWPIPAIYRPGIGMRPAYARLRWTFPGKILPAACARQRFDAVDEIAPITAHCLRYTLAVPKSRHFPVDRIGRARHEGIAQRLRNFRHAVAS